MTKLVKSLNDAKDVLKNAGYKTEWDANEYGDTLSVEYEGCFIQLFSSGHFEGRVTKPADLLTETKTIIKSFLDCKANPNPGTMVVTLKEALDLF